MRSLDFAADAEAPDEGAVAGDVLIAQISEHPLAASDHHHEAAPRVEILFVLAQVLGQLVDARGQQRDLHLRRAGISLMGGIGSDDVGFSVFFERHCRENLLRNRTTYQFNTVSGKSQSESRMATDAPFCLNHG